MNGQKTSVLDSYIPRDDEDVVVVDGGVGQKASVHDTIVSIVFRLLAFHFCVDR